MRVTLENENGVYVVETLEGTDTLVNVLLLLIVPVLLAAGYPPEQISSEIPRY